MLGFVNVFKPSGPTSAQVGARVRGIFSALTGTKLAAGHVGTLDPIAAGVLPVALGKTTRLIPLIEDRRKAYVCTLVLGRATTTGDATGETTRETAVPPGAGALLEEVLPRFLGTIEQTPPMYSALHHEGRRLYELAREGVTVARPPRTVSIYGLRVLGIEGREVRLGIACSEGTYIRTLCEDLGNAVGVAAHMGALLREASGPFVLYESRTLQEIVASPEEALVPPERVIALPTIVLDGRSAADFRAGRVVPLPSGASSKHVFVRDASRQLVGVGENLGVLLAPRKVFV
ncbi:MAG TPA: tRNA pseudouridine(55) synthase TruB [Candidatus Acidoferrales bacterium]|nr:tRNA pseudouridine(55) synthase TruB [Candidatus Acidoferrales bacterium]